MYSHYLVFLPQLLQINNVETFYVTSLQKLSRSQSLAGNVTTEALPLLLLKAEPLLLLKAEPSRIHSHTEYGNEKRETSMGTRNEKREWERENEKRENLPNI
jgi:hypothetical protein